MTKEQLKVQVIGMTWYEESEYAGVLAVMADAHVLHRSYPEWLAAASAGMKRLKASGHVVVKATLHPKEFVIWCGQRGLNIDANARNLWGSEVAKRWLDDQKRKSGDTSH